MKTKWKSVLLCTLVLAACGLVGCGVPGGVAVEGGPSSTRRATLQKDFIEQSRPLSQARYAGPQPLSWSSHRVMPRSLPTPAGLIAHEWGTFTSVQSSAGVVLEGLHHEEEPLPAFVYKRARAYWGKGMEVPAQVTQKLETPVIYFYTKKPMKVAVEVGFPKGIISEWFPNAVSFSPPIQEDQQGSGRLVPGGGKMTWQVELLPGLKQAPPAVSPDDIWAPSRQVPAATPLRFVEPSQGRPREQRTYVKKPLETQIEKFIFYRGIGQFDGWFKVKAPSDQTLELHNASSSAVPQVFLLRVADGRGAIKTLPGMKAGERRKVTVPQDADSLPLAEYVDRAAAAVAKALIGSGLYEKEAWAMVNTWRRSYFKSQTPGVRVLYIVPRADTDRLLPIKITPKPSQLVRTLVGRVEVLTPSVEAETIALLRDAHQNRRSPALDLYGRFGEPRLRRACGQITDASFKKYCEGILRDMVFTQQYNQRP